VLANSQAEEAQAKADGKCNREQTADGPAEQGSGKGERVRQERTAAVVTPLAWQTPLEATSNRQARA